MKRLNSRSQEGLMFTIDMIEALKTYYLACRQINHAVMDCTLYAESSTAWWDK